jgi:transcriptional regulator with XRE-family HTH domain
VSSAADGTEPDPKRGAEFISLRELRKTAGLNQTEVVEAVKRALPNARFSQPALSRVEKGGGSLTPDIVRVLCRIYGVTGAELAALVQRAEDAEAGYVDARVVLQAGNTINLQRRFARLERDAAQISSYNPVMVIGSLQTPAYAATVFGTTEDDPIVRDRTGRQEKMIADSPQRWVVVQTEGSLRWQARSAAVMAEQVEHLIKLSHAPNVDLGVIGWQHRSRYFRTPHFTSTTTPQSLSVPATVRRSSPTTCAWPTTAAYSTSSPGSRRSVTPAATFCGGSQTTTGVF